MSYCECFIVTVQGIYPFNPKFRLCYTLMKTRDAAYSCVDPHCVGSLFFVFPSDTLGEINKLLKYYKYQLTKHCLEGRLEGFKVS